MSGRLTCALVRGLDRLAQFAPKISTRVSLPAHQVTGKRGEEDAYFHLRRLGYVMVARNFRVPRRRGEIDLIGWDHDVLCFIEVKTRTSHDVKPAEAAVDRAKQRELAIMAQEYCHHLRSTPAWRFDVLSVYYVNREAPPEYELFKNAFTLS
jgi:putative endonuclease